VSFEYLVLAEYTNEYQSQKTREVFFLQFALKQLLICNAYCAFEYRLLKFNLLSKILPTSGVEANLFSSGVEAHLFVVLNFAFE
jgi:hypothetical protein